MAAALSRTWGRIVTSKQNFKVVQHLSRCYAVTSVNRKDGVMSRVKKFVFGETVELPDPVYYDLKKEKTPLIYNMNTSEIKEKLDSIMNELDHNKDITDDLVKYKILCRCHEEFGVLFPSFQLSRISQLQDIEDFYYNHVQQPSQFSSLNTLNIENAPPNLKIGGKVPRR